MKAVIGLVLACAIVGGCSDSSNDPATSSGGVESAGGGSAGSTGTSNEEGDTTGTDNSGSDNAAAPSSGGGTADGGNLDEETVTTTCTTTDVGIAFQAINATLISDPDAAPSELVDGCVDRAHSWSGEKGSIVTLDAGSVHQMQGIYIWSTFARMEWIKIESSADSVNWVTDRMAIPTKPVDGPVYYPLLNAGAKRYVRVTGYGSDLNNWTNIAEVRWSALGYDVSGDKVHVIRSETAAATLYSHSLNDRLFMSEDVSSLSGVGACGFYDYPDAMPKYIWVDAYGEAENIITHVSLPNNVTAFVMDWSHLKWPDDFTNDGVYARPADSSQSIADEVMTEQWRNWAADNLTTQEASIASACGQSDTGDLWLGAYYVWLERLPNTAPAGR